MDLDFGLTVVTIELKASFLDLWIDSRILNTSRSEISVPLAQSELLSRVLVN